MNINEYINSLHESEKSEIININWSVLKNQTDLTTPYAQEILSTIINNPIIIPTFNDSQINKDLELINTIGKLSNFTDSFLQNYLNTLTQSALKWTRRVYNDDDESYNDTLIWNPEKLAKHFYYKHNNPLLSNYIHANFKIPDLIHPVFFRASTILDASMLDPTIFGNFITFFTANKKFFFDSTDSEKFFSMKSQNELMNIELNKMYSFLNNLIDSGLPNEFSNNVDHLQLQQQAFFEKVATFFIKYPNIYHDIGSNKIPPIFKWSQKIDDHLKYYSQFEKEHINIIIEKQSHKEYESFVHTFLCNRYITQYSEQYIVNYLIDLIQKDLPLNHLISNMKNNEINIHTTSYNELAETYLQDCFKDNPNLKDIHLSFKKHRFEKMVDHIEITNKPKSSLKI